MIKLEDKSMHKELQESIASTLESGKQHFRSPYDNVDEASQCLDEASIDMNIKEVNISNYYFFL